MVGGCEREVGWLALTSLRVWWLPHGGGGPAFLPP